MSYLIDTLSRFRNHHPSVDIRIWERNKTTIVNMLMDNAIMLGLVNAPVFDRHMTQLLRLRDPIVPIVGTRHPLAIRADDVLHMENLYKYTVFRVSMFPQMTAFIDEVVEQARSGSGGAVIAVPMVMARRLVLMGQGMTFLPESYIRAPVESGEFVRLNIRDMPKLYSEPVVIAYKHREIDEAHAAFIKVLRTTWQHLVVE